MKLEDTERTEYLLRLVADGESFGGFDDGLSDMIRSVSEKYERRELQEDELELAAGGVSGGPEKKIEEITF